MEIKFSNSWNGPVTSQKYGWYEFSAKPLCIKNYKSGQLLVVKYSQPFEVGEMLRCVYADADIELELDVYIQGHTEEARKGKNPRPSITLDYSRIFSVAPAYGLWRRVDDFLTDALVCWPDFLFNSIGWFSLIVIGGWRSSVWQPQLKRAFGGGKGGHPDRVSDYAVADPVLLPIDVNPPQRWRYVDCEKPAHHAPLQFGLAEPAMFPYLPAGERIGGFQGLVPYLVREDEGAYLFPSRAVPQTFRNEDPMTYIYYTFIDEDLFMTFRSHPDYYLELKSFTDYGYRRMPPSPELLPRSPLGHPTPGDKPQKFSYLSYAVWKRLMTTIVDVWPIWQVPRRIIHVENAASLPAQYGKSVSVGAYGPTVTRGFTAGMANSNFNLRFFKDDRIIL